MTESIGAPFKSHIKALRTNSFKLYAMIALVQSNTNSKEFFWFLSLKKRGFYEFYYHLFKIWWTHQSSVKQLLNMNVCGRATLDLVDLGRSSSSRAQVRNPAESKKLKTRWNYILAHVYRVEDIFRIALIRYENQHLEMKWFF